MSRTYDESRQHLIWETALDRLELDVLRAEQMLSRHPAPHDPEPWDEPLVDGPLPHDLLDRALDLRARQEAIQRQLAQALQALSRQSAFTDRVDRATARHSGPVYVDVSA